MKITWAFLSIVAIVAATSDFSVAQYSTWDQHSQYSASSVPTQFPRYGPPAVAPRSTWPSTSAPNLNTFSSSFSGGPQSHQHHQHSPSQASPGIGSGLDYHADPVQTQFATGSHCSSCYVAGRRGGWCGGVSGLVMTRENCDNVWLSYDQADIRDRVLNSNDADFQFSGGFGVNVGRYFNCGRNSINASYWALFSGVPEANAYGADTAVGLDTILHFDGLSYDPGTGPALIGPGPGGGTFHFNAERHRVRREYEVHNIEVNLLGHNYSVGCGSGQKGCTHRGSHLCLGWAAGVRFFRFDEGFLYSTDPNDADFTGDPEELHYGIDVQNNLIGFQLGGRADYCLGGRFSLFADTKVGLYGNHISHNSQIYGSNGYGYVSDPGSPYLNEDIYVDSNKTDVSMIGELLVGGNMCLTRCLTIGAGYRAVGVSGVALSTHQVPTDFIAAIDSLRSVDSDGRLILHGGFLELNFCY